MEDALRDSGILVDLYNVEGVLILVLMEDALRVSFKNPSHQRVQPRLNPCSNGRCSASMRKEIYKKNFHGLNPCSNGRCSAST